MRDCYIFAGGVIESLGHIDCEAVRGGLVICADRGCEYARKLGIVPDVIVGDFDSYSGELPDNAEIIKSVPEKDDTDTMLAVKTAIDRGADRITLYGALGARFDHAFANVQTLIYAHGQGCEMTIADSDNIISVQGAGRRSYPLMKDWYFSVFALSEGAEILSMSGVKYPLENAVLTNGFPLGVSNEITSGEAVIAVRSGLLLVVRSKM